MPEIRFSADTHPELVRQVRVWLESTDAERSASDVVEASTELMGVLARACGHTHLSEFCTDDLTTFDREMAHLAGIAYGGVNL